LGVAVALVHRRIRRQAVEVTVAVDVPYPDALTARQHDVERMVVVRAKTVFRLDQLLGDRIHRCFSDASLTGRRPLDDLPPEQTAGQLDEQPRGLSPLVKE